MRQGGVKKIKIDGRKNNRYHGNVNKGEIKIPIKKISKKFEPYQYYKNEYVQANPEKSEEEIEKVNFFNIFFNIFVYFSYKIFIKRNV